MFIIKLRNVKANLFMDDLKVSYVFQKRIYRGKRGEEMQ